MANNRNYKKSNNASIATIIILAVVTAIFVLIIGWGSNWFTDWTFSNVTDLVNSVFPSDDPDDSVDGDSSDTGGNSSDSGTTDTGSTSGSSSGSGTADTGSTGGSSSGSGTADTGSTSGSSSTETAGEYTIDYDVLTDSTFDYDLTFYCDSSANEGDQVTFYAAVTGDGELYNIIIEGEDGDEIGYTSLGDGEYTLVMPAQNISLTLYINGTVEIKEQYAVTIVGMEFIASCSPLLNDDVVAYVEYGGSITITFTCLSEYRMLAVVTTSAATDEEDDNLIEYSLNNKDYGNTATVVLSNITTDIIVVPVFEKAYE